MMFVLNISKREKSEVMNCARCRFQTKTDVFVSGLIDCHGELASACFNVQCLDSGGLPHERKRNHTHKRVIVFQHVITTFDPVISAACHGH